MHQPALARLEQRLVAGEDCPEASESTIPHDLVSMLDLLAGTIVEALGFGVAAVNIARPDGCLEVVSVAGDAKAREMLLGTVDTSTTWQALLTGSEPWGRLRFVDHRNDATADDMLSWIPDIEAPEDDDRDAWHPEDALFALLTAEDGSLLGTLSVDLPHDGRRPQPATCKALEAFAVSTALAIEHATLRARAEASERRFRELATRDQLTGVGNRSMLLERAGHALSAGLDGRSLLGLAFIDLDDFKAVNDRHSHAAGDHVLVAVASRIQSVVRPEDTVVRWGGDEFLVLADGLADEKAGDDLLARLAAAVRQPVWFAGRQLRVSASVGIAYRRPDEDVDTAELIRRADAQMYRTKNGRHDACDVVPLRSRAARRGA
jgi:diguanylate cyclase (GGDEF)-like protein